jgi:hypothetical protein
MTMELFTADDVRDFQAYLEGCTDAQVRGVYEKESEARREVYAELARIEAGRRGLTLD